LGVGFRKDEEGRGGLGGKDEVGEEEGEEVDGRWTKRGKVDGLEDGKGEEGKMEREEIRRKRVSFAKLE